ncbi:hypothetical protein [Polyangium jinanense]|uniref:Uncharacterized protein n=1 Tax=Polyangium jinanense TaxID=2829994 RepID=A0A9X4AXX1_9BACT|nr:hypothetical protein [Polyangium jinanense]MDC3958404.1 hypothetical protein [Polyangium jinanense]MDC3988266.1 hypothetical protein [Polyangium jinanense]
MNRMKQGALYLSALLLLGMVAACGEDAPGTTPGSTAGTGGGGGTGGEGGAGGRPLVPPGPPGNETVSAGDVLKSPRYKMVFTLGQPTQNQSKTTSPSYRMQGGLIGANGSLP